DKWVVYGDYEKFTAIYFDDDVSTFVFTTDTSDVTGVWSPFVDTIGGIDWGIGKGTHPLMVPDESNEIMIAHFVNAYRAVYDLPPLEYDPALADIARYHSENMSKAKILDHDLNGESPSDRLVKFRYNYTSYAENIARNSYQSLLTVCGWIGSEGHRKNFLTKGVTKMGVGISQKNLFYTWLAAKGAAITEAEPEPEPVKPAKKEFDLSKVVTDKVVPDGTYVLVTKLDTDYALDVYNGSKDNGANVQIWQRNNTAAQNFEVTHIGDGYYTIVNRNSGKAIDAQNGKTEAHTNVWQYSVNGTDAQIWRIIPSTDKTYRILNKASGLFLDVDLAIAANGTNVKLYFQNDDFEAQKWYFMKL
ncbi:MAG: RICIN domain-containing protein, partial [Clostridia bacterium]|nr:RICIN domain-containing protein [Clostridia bacterium]